MAEQRRRERLGPESPKATEHPAKGVGTSGRAARASEAQRQEKEVAEEAKGDGTPKGAETPLPNDNSLVEAEPEGTQGADREERPEMEQGEETSPSPQAVPLPDQVVVRSQVQLPEREDGPEPLVVKDEMEVGKEEAEPRE